MTAGIHWFCSISTGFYWDCRWAATGATYLILGEFTVSRCHETSSLGALALNQTSTRGNWFLLFEAWSWLCWWSRDCLVWNQSSLKDTRLFRRQSLCPTTYGRRVSSHISRAIWSALWRPTLPSTNRNVLARLEETRFSYSKCCMLQCQ